MCESSFFKYIPIVFPVYSNFQCHIVLLNNVAADLSDFLLLRVRLAFPMCTLLPIEGFKIVHMLSLSQTNLVTPKTPQAIPHQFQHKLPGVSKCGTIASYITSHEVGNLVTRRVGRKWVINYIVLNVEWEEIISFLRISFLGKKFQAKVVSRKISNRLVPSCSRLDRKKVSSKSYFSWNFLSISTIMF